MQQARDRFNQVSGIHVSEDPTGQVGVIMCIPAIASDRDEVCRLAESSKTATSGGGTQSDQ